MDDILALSVRSNTGANKKKTTPEMLRRVDAAEAELLEISAQTKKLG
jgi:hypothetical protein